MDLDELRGFLAVVDTGSFLAASTQMGVPRGTLRRRVDALEARAGVELVERGARGVTLTSAGRVLAERGRSFLAEGAALLAAARNIARAPDEPLRLVGPVGLPPGTLDMLMQLGDALGSEVRVEFDIHEDPLARGPDEVDIVFHFGSPTEPAAPAWSRHELVRAPVVVLAARRYLDRRGAPETPAQLADHPLVVWTMTGIERAWPLRGGGEIELQPRLSSNNAAYLREVVRAGRALGLLPDAHLDPLGLADGLVRVLEDEVGTAISLFASIPRSLAERPKLSALMGAINELFARTEVEPR